MKPQPLPTAGLTAFVAVVETGSLHGAADELGLTQSAITKRIQALERVAGVAVLERGRMGARPTELGRVLYPEAKLALTVLSRATDVLSRASGASAHTLRIVASHTIGEFLLPRWLGEFRGHVPDSALQVEVDVLNSPSVLATVRAGEVDFGFVEGVDEPAGLDCLELMRDELVVVVAAAHPWARRRSIAPSELAREQYLTRERDSSARAVLTAALAANGVELTPALVTPSISGLKRAVVGGGFTVLSCVTVENELAAGTLHTLTIRGVELDRTLRAVRQRRPPPRSAAQQLWAWLETRSRGRQLVSRSEADRLRIKPTS